MKTSKAPRTEVPTIGKPQLELLARLSNAISVSGDEDEVRQIIIEQIKPHVDSLETDAMGNLLTIKHSRVPGAMRVMLAAHMDEVGFMLVEDEGEGLYGFELVGGIDERQLLAKTVLVGKDKIPGIIGSKPIHLMDDGERNHLVPVSGMKIDIGPGKNRKVNVGDYAGFSTKFFRTGSSLFGKALDDRLGVATLIELIKHVPENIELLAAFTVQEEIGPRGARIAAFKLDPEIAIVIDSTPAIDFSRPDENENAQYNCRLGNGPAIYISDRGTLSDPRLIHYLVKIAEDNKIPFQFRQPGGGGTDAGVIHTSRAGIPSVSISIPGRYAHTAILHAKVKDWQNTITLLHLVLQSINRDVIHIR